MGELAGVENLFPTQVDLEFYSAQLGEVLLARQHCLVTAESCTGGWVAQVMTAISGSSAWFDRGFVTYSNQAKQEMLGVPAGLLMTEGAVSEAVALAMAEGALRHSRADWSLAITGIAGPTGGSAEKPVGTVWFAWAGQSGWSAARSCRFTGNREQVRAQATVFALKNLHAQIICME